MQALTSGAASALADGYDPGRCRRVLDVGGGTGSFLVALLSAHPQRGRRPGAPGRLLDRPSHTQPLFAALMAAEFLVIAGGDVYSTADVQGWLAETGWKVADQRPLAGPAGLIVAEAV